MNQQIDQYALLVGRQIRAVTMGPQVRWCVFIVSVSLVCVGVRAWGEGAGGGGESALAHVLESFVGAWQETARSLHHSDDAFEFATKMPSIFDVECSPLLCAPCTGSKRRAS